MTTLTLDRAIDQGAIANFSENFLGDDLEVLEALLQQHLTELTRVYRKCVETAYLVKTRFENAAISGNPKTRRDSKAEKEQMLDRRGWTSSVISSLGNVADWLIEIQPENLELLDLKTIEALNKDRFASIRDRLHSECLTIVQVRKEMSTINKALKPPEEPAKEFEWDRAKDGSRYAVVQLDAQVGGEFEREMKQYGEPLALFMREMLRRFKTSEVRMPLNSDQETAIAQSDTWNLAQQELANHVQDQAQNLEQREQLLSELKDIDAVIATCTPPKDTLEKQTLKTAVRMKREIEQKLIALQKTTT
jgi:hypothetical protein